MVERCCKLLVVISFVFGSCLLLPWFNQLQMSSWREGSIITLLDWLMPGAVAQQSQPPRLQNEKVDDTDSSTADCGDGLASAEVAAIATDEPLPPEHARDVARRMMARYAEEQEKQASKWTKQDRLVWEREQQRWIEEGDRLFHDWKALGSTNGISCDMCHPDAADTHPETYPKYQTQLKNMATLRDMINWCIEKPMKGKTLACDDPKMLALEAYMTHKRKGIPLDPGKH